MTTLDTSEVLDLRGRTISTFIAYEATAGLDRLQQGEVLEVVTDDTEPLERDIPAWCRAAGHNLVQLDRAPGQLRFAIEKGVPRATGRSVAFVISDPGLEKLLSPLGFALAAALEGDEVHIYFQGPAVRLLTHGYQAKLGGLGRPFSALARKGMAKQGHLPPGEKLSQLEGLGARFYACGGSMDHFKVRKSDFAFADVPVVMYLSFIELMAEAELCIFVQ